MKKNQVSTPKNGFKKIRFAYFSPFFPFCGVVYVEVGEKISYSQNIYYNELPQKKLGLYP